MTLREDTITFAEKAIRDPDHCKEEKQAAQRFLNDLNSDEWDLRDDIAEFALFLMENLIVHYQGEDMYAVSFRNKPMKLSPFQKFDLYNLFAFHKKGTNERRFKESLLMYSRKNGKTSYVGGIAIVSSLLYKDSGSKCYILANSVKQALEAFNFMQYSVRNWNDKRFSFRDNNSEHSITGNFGKIGSIFIQALASDESRLDSLNANLIILDEAHAMRTSKKYTLMKKATSAYRNKLMLIISTAGDIPNGFLANRLKYCQKVLKGEIKNDSLFIHICKADQDETGKVVDFMDENILKMANPNWGVTVSLDTLKEEAQEAYYDPQLRNEFFNKTLNIFTNSTLAYFNPDDFVASDQLYNWTLEDLAKLPIKWYGGADLSKMHDLTAAALYGIYEFNGKTIDIVITHGFFPRLRAKQKADTTGIPIFEWEDNNWITLSNTDTVHYDDVVKWFIKMKKMGFRIQQVGFDRKFGREFVLKMKKKGFKMIDQPQLFFLKSEGFRRIENKVLNKEFYYLSNEAFEFCVSNVKAVEKVDDAIQYEKLDGDGGNQHIDYFDAAVFSAIQALSGLGKNQNISHFFASDKKEGE